MGKRAAAGYGGGGIDIGIGRNTAIRLGTPMDDGARQGVRHGI